MWALIIAAQREKKEREAAEREGEGFSPQAEGEMSSLWLLGDLKLPELTVNLRYLTQPVLLSRVGLFVFAVFLLAFLTCRNPNIRQSWPRSGPREAYLAGFTRLIRLTEIRGRIRGNKIKKVAGSRTNKMKNCLISEKIGATSRCNSERGK